MINDYIKQNFHYEKRYLYCDEVMRFIYDTVKGNNIIGMNNILFNKVIGVKNEILGNENTLTNINCEYIINGWVRLENVIRIYRVPSINGKINASGEYFFNSKNYYNRVEKLINKVVKVLYTFEYHGERYYLINGLSESDSIPIKAVYFEKLTIPSELLTVNIKENTPYFGSSSFETELGKILEPDEYKVASFYEGTNKVKILYQKRYVWVKSETVIPKENDIQDINNLELIDMIIAFDEKYKSVKKQNEVLENTLNEIRENIVVDTNEDQLYLKRYLGDVNDK